MNNNENHNWLTWMFYFTVFEVVVFAGLQWLLSDMGMNNQMQADNTIVLNWVKTVLFIFLYILCLLFVMMMVSNFVPSKHRRQLMRWVYLALVGMVVMLFFIF